MGVPTVRAFAPLMRQRVSIEPCSTYDSYGAPSYGTAVVYQCAVVGEMKMIMKADGQEVPSKQAVYLMSNAAVRPEDRITLSTGDVGSTESYAINPAIVAIERYPFTAGQFVTVVRLGDTRA
jgi:hypothetical protein